MNQRRMDRFFHAVIFIWAAAHLIVGWSNFIDGIHHGSGPEYGWESYLVTACYLFLLLAVMALTVRGKRRGAARYLEWYWLASLLVCILAMFVKDAAGFAVLAVLLTMITPIYPLGPFLILLPGSEQASGAVLSAAGLILCLWIQRKY